MRRLIVSPHRDDEVLGCGGLLAKYPDDCYVVVLADSDETRKSEFKEAQSLLGYKYYFSFGFTDGYVGADTRKLTTLLDNLVNDVQPDELYLPFPSTHQDHIAAYEAGIRTSRLSMGSEHWFTPNIYVYDVAAYDLNLYQTGLKWDRFLSLSEAEIDKKVSAIGMYGSQLVEGVHPVNGIKEIARALGASRQVSYAEQFAVVRQVV